MMKEKKFLIALILVHVFIILLGILFVIPLSNDYSKTLLIDDGYYNIANDFVNGGSLSHRAVGPLLPLIFSVIHFFPQFLHPFIRLLIALSFSIGIIIILWNITKVYIIEKQFFWGSLFFIFNPMYNHWILKSSPEIYLAFFMGLFILLLLKYYRTRSIKYLIYSIGIFILSIFLKPVFLLIPFSLLLSTIFIKSKKILIISMLFTFFSLGCYTIFYKLTHIKYDHNIEKVNRFEYGPFLLIDSAFLADYIIKTRRLHKGTIIRFQLNSYTENSYNFEGYAKDIYNRTSKIWIANFFDKYPGSNYLFMNLYFIYDKPLLVLQKLLVSPIFFFSLSAYPIETCIMLIVSIFSIFFSILGIRKKLKDSKIKKEIVLIIFIIIGFSFLYFIFHSIGRYSIPILPYLYVWGGIPISKFFSDLFYKYKKVRND